MFFKKKRPHLTIKQSKIIGILVFIFAVISYLCFDKPISEAMRSPPHFLALLSDGISSIFNPFDGTLLLFVLFYIVRILLKKERLGNQFLLIALSSSLLNAIIIPIKMLFGRFRPELWISNQQYGFDFLVRSDLEMSFPSGHAITIFSIFVSLSCLYPKKSPLFLILALVLSFCRVIENKHYLSDILASLLIAFFGCQWIYYSMKRAKIEFN